MKHIVTFKTSFLESSDYDHPKGYSICKYLGAELAKDGFGVQPLENYRDMAWSVDCCINDKKMFFFVGYLGTEITDWQLIICSNIGLIGRLLGRRDEDERIKLARAIHGILVIDERFSDVKWYSRYTGGPKDMWFGEPS